MTTPLATTGGPAPRLLGTPRERAGAIRLRHDRIRLRTVVADGRLVGHVTEVIADPAGPRVAGFEIRTPDRQTWFVPLHAVAAVGPTGIEVASALHVVAESTFYRSSGRPAGDLVGMPLVDAGGRIGHVDDVIVSLATGQVVEYVLEDGRRLGAAGVVWDGDTLRLV